MYIYSLFRRFITDENAAYRQKLEQLMDELESERAISTRLRYFHMYRTYIPYIHTVHKYRT